MSTAKLKTVPLNLSNDTAGGLARAEGNNAAWLCPCGELLPLIGRASGNPAPVTECPRCGARYQVRPNAEAVDQVGPATALPRSPGPA
jgi:hypothetical protein